jgi:quercetin dioxygenase-like cupin family protein
MPDEWKEMAAAYALGVLEDDEAELASARARQDAAFAGEARRWSERFATLNPLPEDGQVPPAEAWHAICARTGSQRLTRHADEGVWLPGGDGITVKMLTVDPPSGRRTALMRLQPGALLPAHDHEDFEECLVVEGEVDLDGVSYRVGDYLVAPTRTTHNQLQSPKGALVLLHWTPG